MSMKDWMEKDYYKVLGVPKDADSARSRRPIASSPASCADTNPDPKAWAFQGEVSEGQRCALGCQEACRVRRGPSDDRLAVTGYRARRDRARTSISGTSSGAPAGTPATSARPCLGCSTDAVRSARPTRPGHRSRCQHLISWALRGLTTSMRLTSEEACPDCAGTGAKAGTTPRVPGL